MKKDVILSIRLPFPLKEMKEIMGICIKYYSKPLYVRHAGNVWEIFTKDHAEKPVAP